jgi:hypothetical protein
VYRPIAKQWLCKQWLLLGNTRSIHACSNRRTVFSMWSVPRSYLEDSWCCSSVPCVEAGSNTSNVTLRVVEGDEKWSLKSETVKYGCESQGTWTQERPCWQGPAACTNDRPVLSSERAPHKEWDCNCQTVINIWSWAPDWAWHEDRLTDWLTDRPSVAMWLWLWLWLVVQYLPGN